MSSEFSTIRSQELYAEASQVIPCGVSSSMRKNIKPILFFERADGPYYFDVDGNKYIDYTLAWGPLIVGSNHPVLNKAVTDQLQTSYTLGAQHRLEISLAQSLVNVLPGVEQVAFSNTGSEAVQSAIRIARTKTGREKIVKFEGHYHGWNNDVLVSYKPSREQLGTPSSTCGGQPASEFSNTLVLPWNDAEALEKLLQSRGAEIACVITEPILANSGSCMPKDGYLQEVIDICRKYGVISIFDEVIAGFRLALGGAREYFNINPDMSIYAKAIAGGFTMAAIGSRKDIFEVLVNGQTIHAGTYNGSSINLAAALATLSILSEENCFDKLHEYGYSLRTCIEKEAKANGIQLVTSGVGSVFSIHFGLEQAPMNYTACLDTDMDLYGRFRLKMLEEGIHLLPDGRWYVGTSHSDTELAMTIEAITKVFASLA